MEFVNLQRRNGNFDGFPGALRLLHVPKCFRGSLIHNITTQCTCQLGTSYFYKVGFLLDGMSDLFCSSNL